MVITGPYMSRAKRTSSGTRLQLAIGSSVKQGGCSGVRLQVESLAHAFSGRKTGAQSVLGLIRYVFTSPVVSWNQADVDNAKIVPLIDGWIRTQRGDGNLLAEDEQPISLRLVQDNAPAHASRDTIEDRHDRLILVENWPPFSPDLNPIENCWNWMKDYLDKKWGDDYCPMQAMRARILESWQSAVTEERLDALIRDMPARCAAVIAAEGGPTKW